MKVVIGDLWTVKADYRGIPTNGMLTKVGYAIMGRGVAYQAKKQYPDIERRLGTAIQTVGNHLYLLEPELFSFPVKHNWWDRADLDLIRRSACELTKLAAEHPDKTFTIPLPGTDNGHLQPGEVWPLLEDLPDNVTVVVLSSASLPSRVLK